MSSSGGPTIAPESRPAGSFDAGPAQGNWGPLAVTKDTSRGFALAGGVLRITDACTYLLGTEGQVAYLLVWRAADTRWDAEDRRIVFRNPEYRDPPSQVFLLDDGESIQIGGGAVAFDESPPDSSDPSWAAPPDVSCSAPALWYVGEIVTDQGTP
jgi:hypothetical protein